MNIKYLELETRLPPPFFLKLSSRPLKSVNTWNLSPFWNALSREFRCRWRHLSCKLHPEIYNGFTFTLIKTRMRFKQIRKYIYRFWGIRTTRYLDISVLNICDISVLSTGHFGTRHIGTEWKANRYFQRIIIWLNLKTYFVFFLHLDVVYRFFIQIFMFVFFNHLIKLTSKRQFINICK